MATKKFSAFTAGSTNQVPTDVLVGLDLSLAAASQNTKWTLNNLFSVVTRNITDGALRFGGFAAPAVSGAGEGSIYFDSTSNTFKLSQNAGAYFNVGNVTTAGFTSTRVPIANGANSLTDNAGLSFSGGFLQLGTAAGGGATFVGSNGNTVSLAANSPSAASYLYYLPNAAPTVGQFMYAAAVGAQTTLGWITAPSGSGSANQVAVWGASNALTGSSALTSNAGVLSVSGTTAPGVVVTNTIAGTAGYVADQTVSGAASYSFLQFSTPSTAALIQLTTAGYTPANLVKANQLRLLGSTGTVETLFDMADASTRFVFGVNNVEAASINATSTLGLVLGVASTLTGRVRLFNSAGATYTQISAGNAAASLNYILPATSPSASQVLTASAPSGSDVTLSWSTPSSGASLTATQVGFGSGANALTGSADFTYTDATGVLDLTKTGINGSVRVTVANASAGTAAQARFGASANVSGSALIAYSSTFTTSGLRVANSAVLDLDGPNAVILGQAAGVLQFGLGSTEYARLNATRFGVISFGLGASPSSLDVLLERDAANTLAQRNGTNAQTFRVYNTFTDASNYERLEIQAASSQFFVSTRGTGTGVGRDLNVGTEGLGSLIFRTSGTSRWNVSNSGHLLASTDNTYDIGANGATRPRTGYFGTGLQIINTSNAFNSLGVLISSTSRYGWDGRSSLTSPSDGVITLANGAATDFSRLQFGGTTSSFPAIGRSGASVVIQLADGTLQTPILPFNTNQLQFGGADAASPGAISLRVQNVAAGTSNTSGQNFSLYGCAGTGNAVGGAILLRVAPAGSSGTSQNATIVGLAVDGTGRLYGSAIHNNAAGMSGAVNQYIGSGTYTPTVTAVANCTASAAGTCSYLRVGNVVTVSGQVTIDPTTTLTLTQVGISLPLASNLASSNNCNGVACNPLDYGEVAAIAGDSTNDRAELQCTPTAVTSRTWSFTFTYEVL